MNKDFNSLLDLEFAPIAEVKAKLSEKLRQTAKGKRVAITSHGQPSAVLVSYEDFLDLLRGLANQPGRPNVIDYDDWKNKKAQRKKISRSILQHFAPEKLSRKGQKKYKQDAVHGFAKGN